MAGPASAQTLPHLAIVQGAYSRLKANVKPEGDLKREIDAIDKALAEAIRLGRNGEARRLLAKGTSLLNGRPWTDLADFAGSVVLRSDRLFVDPVRAFTLRVEQIYSSTLELSAPPTARITLRRLIRSSQPVAGQAQVGDVVKDFGSFEGVPRDLRESPFLADLDLTGVGDGRYVVVTELFNGEQALAARGLAIEIRKDLDARLHKLDTGARAGSDLAQALRADILYPGDYIRRANRGVIDSGDFDVEKEIADAEATLASLNGRRDPFAGRTGEFKRHYLMAESGEIMPYHLYVPASYSGRKPVPLVVALHGNGANEDSFFLGGPRQVPLMAEERGFLVVAPLGYRVDAGYGRTTPTSSQDPTLKRKRELSEADVLHVLDLVRKAYRVDEDRIYLFGHSMGAAGTWYLGAKFPDRWAALACFSGPGVPATVEQMRHIAQFVVHGDADPVVAAAESRAMVSEMKRLGVEHRYVEVPGGDHYNVLEPYVGAAFEFFDKHRRQKVGA
jgi:predicted esterase